MLPKIEFLWDEEKNTKLLKQLLIGTLTGSIIAIVFILILPKSFTPHPLFLLADPIVFVIFAIMVLLLKFAFNKKISSGFLLLLTLMYLQGATIWFQALTGGFQSISQFTPFALMMLAIFLVGSEGTLILGIFSTFTIVGLYLWVKSYSNVSTTPQELFFYLGIYIILAFFLRSLGRELSLQIEARKKLEQVDDLKNQFITLASHYLRTPLTVINASMSELGLEITDLQGQKSIENIKANISKLYGLTERLLTISEIEKGQARIVKLNNDINQVASQAVEKYRSVANQQKVNLVFIPASIPIERFTFDRTKIENVLLALIDNAIKYNKAGGTVKVILQNGSGQARIDISDTGVGINKEHLGTLFSTFNRGTIEDTLNFDKPGMGLGLYLTKLIVEAHDGEIFVESKIGEGSNFTVILPKGN